MCRLTPHPPCMRYKVRPARVVDCQSGTKFALHAQNSPKRAISSEQGEFYTARAMRRGVQGDFCTGSGDVWLVQGEFCLAMALSVCSVADLSPLAGTAAVPSGPSGALHSRLLSLTGGAGNSRETVITVAGVCFASGETDDTIASQIHLFLVLFHRAKASWVSWRRPDVSALVPTVSSRGAVSSIGVTKFAQRRLSMAVAPNHSPSAGKMAQNGRLYRAGRVFSRPPEP